MKISLSLCSSVADHIKFAALSASGFPISYAQILPTADFFKHCIHVHHLFPIRSRVPECRASEGRDGGDHDSKTEAEAEVVEPEVRVVPEAVRAARVELIVEPGAATQHSQDIITGIEIFAPF
jgi:hypothetical protein